MQAFSFNAVHMREDQVDCILGKVIETFALWDNVAKEGVILFDFGFLVSFIWVTEEQFSFFYTIQVIFK